MIESPFTWLLSVLILFCLPVYILSRINWRALAKWFHWRKSRPLHKDYWHSPTGHRQFINDLEAWRWKRPLDSIFKEGGW